MAFRQLIVSCFVILFVSLPAYSVEAIQGQSVNGIEQNNYKMASQYSAEHRGVSILVLKDGKVVYEEYTNGADPSKFYELASGTKSFSGIAAVAAQEDGLLYLDEKVSKTISEWKDDPVRKDITIRQLLHLTAGVQGGPGRPPTYNQAIYQEILGIPGSKFKYGPSSFQIFGELLYRKLDKKETLADYLDRRIFSPIGMEVSNWKYGADNMPLVPQGAKLTANNWAKFGEFVLNGGRAQGKQILKEESINQCFVGTKANPMYGLTWWLNRPIDPELRKTITPLTASSDIEYGSAGVPDDLVMAAGAGGQRLYIIPSKNMVIVRQADKIFASLFFSRGAKFSDQDFLSRIFLGKPKVNSSQSTLANNSEASQTNRGMTKRKRRFQRLMERFDSNRDGNLDEQERSQLRQFVQRWRNRGR